MISNDTIFKVKDSVDLFLSDNCFLTAYYINTRQRQSFRINEDMVYLLESIDGVHNVAYLYDRMSRDRNIAQDSVHEVLQGLLNKRIITETRKQNHILTSEECKKYSRQINYFSEFCGSEDDGLYAQKKVMNSNILVFGCGAIGSAIALLLVMAGVQRITLFDYDIVEDSDKTRHMFFHDKYLGKKKTYALKRELLSINNSIQISVVDESLLPGSDIEDLIIQHDFVVNTLDEPYIGYTASKISRICIKHKVAHFIAGGFDAHLASTGELIIPYVTPCVECYATHFKESLKGWKPKKHPVIKRDTEIGGLAAMSLFSSSYAGIEILKFLAGIVDFDENYKIRGEFLFHDFSITYLNVKRNPECPICGGGATL